LLAVIGVLVVWQIWAFVQQMRRGRNRVPGGGGTPEPGLPAAAVLDKG
jgi:hypothetical protein